MQKELMHNIREECDKLISKQWCLQNKAKILKCKVQYLYKMCSTEKKQKDALKPENAALCQKMKEQVEVSLKLIDGCRFKSRPWPASCSLPE